MITYMSKNDPGQFLTEAQYYELDVDDEEYEEDGGDDYIRLEFPDEIIDFEVYLVKLTEEFGDSFKLQKSFNTKEEAEAYIQDCFEGRVENEEYKSFKYQTLANIFLIWDGTKVKEFEKEY